MTEPALDADGINSPRSDHWPAELDADYERISELGRGGMAVVYRARDRELGRDVAIKVVRPRFASDEEAVGRLAREARTVAKIEHPNIVGMYAIRHMGDRSDALVMKHVPLFSSCPAGLSSRRSWPKVASTRRGPSTSFAKSLARSPTPSRRAWCIAT
jgi:serine/threonine protein kinase